MKFQEILIVLYILITKTSILSEDFEIEKADNVRKIIINFKLRMFRWEVEQ